MCCKLCRLKPWNLDLQKIWAVHKIISVGYHLLCSYLDGARVDRMQHEAQRYAHRTLLIWGEVHILRGYYKLGETTTSTSNTAGSTIDCRKQRGVLLSVVVGVFRTRCDFLFYRNFSWIDYIHFNNIRLNTRTRERSYFFWKRGLDIDYCYCIHIDSNNFWRHMAPKQKGKQHSYLDESTHQSENCEPHTGILRLSVSAFGS